MIILPDWLMSLAEYAEQIGLPVILSCICLLQYLTHLYYRYSAHDRENKLRSNLEHLAGEMSQLQSERWLAKLENNILREIFGQTSSGRTIEMLLKTFVPNASQGFVGFFNTQHQSCEIMLHRGLTSKTANQLVIDPEWLSQLDDRAVVRISGSQLARSEFVAGLSVSEKKKLTELYLVAVADGPDRIAVIATTQLFPANVDLAMQQELIGRILESVTGSIRQTLDLVDQQSLLKMTQEKLALRVIADRHYDTPPKLLDDYLNRLIDLVEADRGTVMVFAESKSNPFELIRRQGITLQASLEPTWRGHELCLANWARERTKPCSLGASELASIGIGSLMGSTLVLPLRDKNKAVGLLLLVRRDNSIFSAAQNNLADWAAKFLAETLMRVLGRAQVERAATLDGLTELANRRLFDERIRKELETARINGTELSLGLFDLDHFKQVNDTYGHQAGDEVLKHFARLLEQQTRQVRSTDTPLVARYGGEEMAVLLPGIGIQGALRIAESIRLALDDSVVLYEKRRITPSVSVGLSCFPRHAHSVEELIRTADQALYQAKQSGRNTVRAAKGFETDSQLSQTNLHQRDSNVERHAGDRTEILW